MRMTLKLLIFGGMLIFASVLFISVILPWATMPEKPSEPFRPWTALEAEGRKIYVVKRMHLLPYPVHPVD